jgi:hypothetical protein
VGKLEEKKLLAALGIDGRMSTWILLVQDREK